MRQASACRYRTSHARTPLRKLCPLSRRSASHKVAPRPPLRSHGLHCAFMICGRARYPTGAAVVLGAAVVDAIVATSERLPAGRGNGDSGIDDGVLIARAFAAVAAAAATAAAAAAVDAVGWRAAAMAAETALRALPGPRPSQQVGGWLFGGAAWWNDDAFLGLLLAPLATTRVSDRFVRWSCAQNWERSTGTDDFDIDPARA